jgi:hypothetical protein
LGKIGVFRLRIGIYDRMGIMSTELIFVEFEVIIGLGTFWLIQSTYNKILFLALP